MNTEGTECPIPENASNVLREIRIKNINRVINGALNINSLPTKFEELKLLIANYLEVLVIEVT